MSATHGWPRLEAWLASGPPRALAVGCGPACPPTRALEGLAAPDGWLYLVLDRCAAVAHPSDVVALALAARGALVIVDGHAAVRERWAPLLGAAPGRVRSAVAVPTDMPRLDVRHPPVGRRSMLLAQPVGGGQRSSRFHGPEALVEAVKALGQQDVTGMEWPAWTAPADGGNSPAARLLADGCTACGTCVRACPHDALSGLEKAGRWVLTQDRLRCQGEAACVAACPVDALTSSGMLPWPQVAADPSPVLTDQAVVHCERCGAVTTRPDGLCEPCHLRRRDPFGSHLPSQVRARLDPRRLAQLDDRP